MPQPGDLLLAGSLRQRQYRTMYAPCRPLQRPPVRWVVLQRLQEAARGGFTLQSRRPRAALRRSAPVWLHFIIGPAAACMHRAAMIAHQG